MAPECLPGKRQVKAAEIEALKTIDLYGLGMTIFQCINVVAPPFDIEIGSNEIINGDKPTMSEKYAHLRTTAWSAYYILYIKCTEMEPLQQNSAEEVLNYIKVDLKDKLAIMQLKNSQATALELYDFSIASENYEVVPEFPPNDGTDTCSFLF